MAELRRDEMPARRFLDLIRRHFWSIALGVWFLGLSFVAAGMLARHTVALPGFSDRGGAPLAALRTRPDQGRWLAIHALYAECGCSLLITDHLLHSERPAGWTEIVLWTGEGAPNPELERHGFRVQLVSREQLARYGIESVPSLIALDPTDGVRYAGGYTQRAPGLEPEDLRILEESRLSPVAALPVFGCAISERLRHALALLPTL
jgi:hypothetical protein